MITNSRIFRKPSIFVMLIFAGLHVAHAHTGEDSVDAAEEAVIEELVVYGRSLRQIGKAHSGSEGLVGYDDIQLPPILRVGELVEAVPGMVATQHSGTGKANQYFIRGFNLDHGTDFAASIEGVPINMRTHGHGQGYLDLNFLIPELVEKLSYRRGPYATSIGDFSSAASVDFKYFDRLPESIVSMTAGEYGYYRGLTAMSLATDTGALTGAVDYTAYEGPWDLEEDLSQLKFVAAYDRKMADVHAKLVLQGYDSVWDATDQVPRRAVDSGLISARGFVDPDLGGETSRYSLTGALAFDALQVTAYLVDYEFSLYSNFTYFLNDADDGDEFEQRDDRRIYGIVLRGKQPYTRPAGTLEFRWGADLRVDDIGEVGLYQTDARVRRSTVREDIVDELSLGTFVEAEMPFGNRLRAILGVRGDYYDWDVTALRSANSGGGNDSLVSPKAALAYRFSDGLEGYLNWGRSFHSNDVRGATISVDPASGLPVDAVDVLVASNGAEAGLRLERNSTLNASLVAFWLELDSELTFVGDAGATEANGATARRGIEATVFWQATDWLAINAAYTKTDARFEVDQGGGREIPGAVESTFTLGVNGAWASGLIASLRLRYLGEAPLVEDGSVTSDASLLVNAGLAYRTGLLEYRLDLLNALDSGDDDIAYFYASRLPGEPAAGVDDIHFHPLEPRTVRASVILRWE